MAKKSDAIVPNTEPGANKLFDYSAGATGVASVGRDNGVYLTAFLGSPILALPFEDPDDTASIFDMRNDLIGTFLDYCLQIEKDDAFEVNDDGEAGKIRSDMDDQRATRLQGDVNLTDLRILPGNDDWYRWETTVQTDTRFNGASDSYTLKFSSEFTDTDDGGISNVIDTDDDGDGMSDDFGIQFGLDPLFSGDAFLDTDGDGFTNLDDTLGGSDPTNAGPVPTPPPNLSPLSFFGVEECAPDVPRHVCSPIRLHGLGVLLGNGK